MRWIAALFAVLLIAGPAIARESADSGSPRDSEEWRQAQKYAEEGAEKLRQSFELLLDAMPYGLPRMDADGNIIIPRQHPHPAPAERSWLDRGRT
jgi:hypothetical protein